MVESVIDLRPKRADNVFARRRSISKVFRFTIEVSILPGLKRLFDRLFESAKIPKRSAPFVIFAANRCLRQIAMTMTMEIVALPVELRVLGIRKSGGVQSMRGVERHLQPEKNSFAFPHFRKKIIALVQAEAMQRQTSVYALVDITGEALSRHRTIF